ncbi:Conserved oligomeric Golgi complex subunit 5 [Echinococcus granulosus]|nr:Conserved oligomeric Golgi complex subunit 5 [Echinococcus granulosus]
MDSDRFLKLLQNDFDEKVFVSKVFETNNLLEPLKMVSERLSELDASISQHVSKHNNELLNQTVELENFSNIVGSVESRIMSVSGSVNMIKQRIAKHYDHLSTQVTLIRRLGIVYEALRGILRISSTSRKLHASSDIVQSSECIEELDYTFNLVEWKGITVLEEQHKDVVKEKERVTREAWELVHTSFKSRDRAGLGLALQAFNNLSVLPKVIQALVSDWQTEIESAVKSSADVEDLSKRAKGKVISSLTSTAPGKASLPSGGGHSAAFRNLLWAGLDQMVGTLDQCLAQVRMLCVILKKKRSSAGNASTSTTLFSGLCNYLLKNLDNPDERDCCIAIMMVLYNEERNCANDFVLSKIRQLAKKVDSCLAEVCSDGLLGWIVTCLNAIFEPALRRRSGQLKEALERDYPRLLKLFLNISDQQQLLSDPIRNFLSPFETAYLGRCLTRLCDREMLKIDHWVILQANLEAPSTLWRQTKEQEDYKTTSLQNALTQPRRKTICKQLDSPEAGYCLAI